MQYDVNAAKAQYVEAGCTENEVIAVTMPLKALLKADNGLATGLAGRERKDNYTYELNQKLKEERNAKDTA